MLRATVRLLLTYVAGVALLFISLTWLGMSEAGGFAFFAGAPILVVPILVEIVLAVVRGVPPRELVATWALACLALMMFVSFSFVTWIAIVVALTSGVAVGHLASARSAGR